MKIYLVGGAVRDQLLNLSPKERDWVVVGARPQDLLEQGFIPVGKDFPVFLHPKTKEEYALARTERKSGPGYHGFDCHFSPDVTLEEDLQRRDLTINAMAMDDKGQLIDPYQGQVDLKARLLRHVSSAFSEDPVRILRLARFAARYHYLGFSVHPETNQLMYRMQQAGELQHLVPERVWKEWQSSLKEKNPEIFITTLRACGTLEVILPEIHALFGIPNSAHYHPEVDSGIHTLFALKEAARLSQDPLVRFGALVHDLGKAATPMVEWPKHHQHEQRGLPILRNLCQRLRIPASYQSLGELICAFHLQIHAFRELRASTVVRLLEKVDAFRRPERFEQLLLACEADAQGSGFRKPYPQAQWWQKSLKACQEISASSFVAKGLQGSQIQAALHEARVDAIKVLLTQWKENEK